MTRKSLLLGAAIICLLGLNYLRYFGSSEDIEMQNKTANTSPLALPELLFPVAPSSSPPQASRDLFTFIASKPNPKIIAPEPIISEPSASTPDPREVEIEAARRNMLNIRVTGIISSRSGLSAMVNAPFYEGIAYVGTELGEGILVEAVNASRVLIIHPKLELKRDIRVE